MGCVSGTMDPLTDIAPICVIREFPTCTVQSMPILLNDNTIIYCTRYEEGNDHNTGIFEYNINTDTNKLIKSWVSMEYYPRFHAIIYSKHRNTLYSVGGVNVKNNHKDYDIIFAFNLSTQHSQTISFDYNATVGSNSKLLLTENDNFLHIIGGLTENDTQMHIELDLNTNKSRVIHDFTATNPNLSEHGVLFNKTTNQIYMFGGTNLYDAQGFNS